MDFKDHHTREQEDRLKQDLKSKLMDTGKTEK